MQSNDEKSGVDYYSKLYKAPLLPFEKQLIATIGATEEEYRLLVTEALKRSRVRPAGYGHIPDVQAKGLLATFLINLAIGITLSVITYMLTPKPKQPKGIGQRKLGDINNAGRFTPTHGFESQAELANYGEPIPIIFGKAEFNGEDYVSGGMLVSPRLVWSRMYSWGTQQAVKLGFIVGEQGESLGLLTPDLSGIFLGNNPLDSIYSSSFAFFWCKRSRDQTGSRVLKGNFKYGDVNIRSVNPSRDEILRCPTEEGSHDTGFSSTYSPSNNVEFGCFSPIPNGSAYRVNWVNVPMTDPGGGKGDHQPEHSEELAWQRIKIMGWYTNLGYHGSDNPLDYEHEGWRNPTGIRDHHKYIGEGIGRNYPRRMGLRLYYKCTGYDSNNNPTYASEVEPSNDEVTSIITNIQVDDRVEFFIQPGTEKLDEYIYTENSGVRVDDINSEIDSQREAADDALQLGEVFQIGRTVWRVVSRKEPIWKASEDKIQKIMLQCIDNNGGIDNQIGIVCDAVLYPNGQSTSSGKTSKGEDGKFGYGWINDSDDPSISKIPGAGFFPLLRRSKAIFKNTRNCEVTEIGLRSRVNQQLSGLCNFQSLLSHTKIWELETDNIAVQSGTISTSIKRASLFTIKVRSADKSYNNDLEGWIDFGLLFAIIGSSNVDQYNQIRIKHPERKRFEYQVFPVAGAGLYKKPDNTVVWHLKDSLNSLSEEVDTPEGRFTIEMQGEKTDRISIKRNNEFVAGQVTTTHTETTIGAPRSIVYEEKILGKEEWEHIARMTECEWTGKWGGTGSGANEGSIVDGRGRGGAFMWELFGQATASSPDEIEGTFDFTTTGPTRNKPVRLKIKARKWALPSDHWMAAGGSAGESETHSWSVVGSDSDTIYRRNEGVVPDLNEDPANNLDWTNGDFFRIQKSCAGSNPWAQKALNGPLAYAGLEIKVTGHDFIQDVVRGRGQSFQHEIFGSAESETLHSQKEVQITLTTSSSMDSANSSNTGWKTNIAASPARTLTVKFRGTVIDLTNDEGRSNWTGRYRGWRRDGIDIVSSTGDWDENNEIDLWKDATSASNPFWRELQGKNGWKLRISAMNDDSETTTTVVDETSARVFEGQSQYSDISHYGNLVQKSNGSGPEHQVVYVNEMVSNTSVPKYTNTTTAALILKASRSFSSLDQIRVWLKEGISVEHLHPDDGSVSEPSNLFTDLIYYLLTNRVGGVGQALGSSQDAESLVDKTGLAETSRFLRTNKLLFNGALADPVNIRGYISEMAPAFLCDFILADGKFSLKPAVPVNSSGEISDGAVEIKQLFTSGNILEDSFKLDYINVDERRKFKAVIRYREESQNKLPIEQTTTVRHAGGDGTEAIETFDLTGFCTTRKHAQLVGKYYLSLRERVKHTCSFQTTPYGLDLAPGDFIRVTTESSPYNAANNGSISAAGVLTSIRDIPNGSYEVYYYTLNEDVDVERSTMQVDDGKVTESKFFNSIFSIVENINSQNVYRVEQLTLSQDNVVDVVASEYPCDNDSVSLIARDLRSSSTFTDETGAFISYHL